MADSGRFRPIPGVPLAEVGRRRTAGEWRFQRYPRRRSARPVVAGPSPRTSGGRGANFRQLEWLTATETGWDEKRRR
ncbi:hypothetical protein L3X38_032344 [Prunus dulcis]|uniref:Uncharacterized protein n=1 Tax=Prunus dulcis TaxID=3755 RepID=A0AAD4YUW3_PRUDU|nr:hypothetical protein L3X38_032344 [Prunus dulcis]